MKMRILSVLLVFLLVISVAAPVGGAAFAAPAIPLVVNIVVDGVVVATVVATVAVATAEDIGNHLKKTWDGAAETLNKFASDVSASLGNVFSAKNWICAASHESAAMLEFEYFASGGAGSKPDDKWYHKAERDENGEVKVNTERISEQEAAEELKEGRSIFTTTEERARNLVNKVSKEKVTLDDNLETHGSRENGFFEHYHPNNQFKKHLPAHCWFWKR